MTSDLWCLSLWSEIMLHTTTNTKIFWLTLILLSHAIFCFREDRNNCLSLKVITTQMETPACFEFNRLDSLFCLASCISQRCPERDPRRRLWTSLSSYCSLLSERWSPVRNRNRNAIRLVWRVSNEPGQFELTGSAFINRCFSLWKLLCFTLSLQCVI